MTKGINQLDAIEIILREHDVPLSASQIVKEIHRRQIATLDGKTPTKTVNARISVDIAKKGESSRFKRVEPGVYTLRGRPEEEFFSLPRQKRIDRSDRVLVFPSSKIEELGYFHGIKRDYLPYFEGLFSSSRPQFISRLEAESTEEYKQIVSYVILKYEDKLLQFTRGGLTNVDDLVGMNSIGFGGHVSYETDFSMFDKDLGYAQSVARELSEEININVSHSEVLSSIVGVINDVSTNLGRRHFAFVHLLELKTPEFKKGEMSVRKTKLVDISQLGVKFGSFEYWSKLCISAYFADRLSIKSYVERTSRRRLKVKTSIINVVGSIGSGKSEACKILEDHFGYSVVRVSQVIQQLLKLDKKATLSRSDLQDLGYSFVMSEGGHHKLAQGIIEAIRATGSNKVVVDGLRYPETYRELARNLKRKPPTIYLENTVDRAYEFFVQRESQDISFKEFLSVLSHVVERDVERFTGNADFIVYNYGSLVSFHEEIKNFFEEYLG